MMKWFISLCLALALCLACLPALGEWRDSFADADSARYDGALAEQLLEWSGLCYRPDTIAQLTSQAGFAMIGAYNYERAAEDTRHVCAYSLHEKELPDGREAVCIVIRGTGEGEWPLNVQLMPSGDYSLPYAENFTLAAQNILDERQAYLESLDEPVFFITGHSRGAACANVLGALLTERYGAQNVYCYTFATPRTVRGAYPAYDNVFNIINPEDFVTYLPLPQWGFERYGRDIILPVEDAEADDLALVNAVYTEQAARYGYGGLAYARFADGKDSVLAFINAMAALAPTAQSGYTDRHSLSGPGLAGADEAGETAGGFITDVFSGMLGGGKQADLLVKVSAMKANRTDFDPLLNVLLSYILSGNITALGCAHMPAVYGAWMRLMD